MAEVKDRGLTVTIKLGKDYDAPWVVFHGSTEDIDADLRTFYGLSLDEELTTHDVLLEAATHAKATYAAAGGLGARTMPTRKARGKASPFVEEDATAEPAQLPPAKAEGSEPEPEAAAEEVDDKTAIIAEFANVSTTEDLKRLWKDNQALFADPEVMAAYKERGKAIKAAS